MRIKHVAIAMGVAVVLVGYCLSHLDSGELLGLRAQGMDQTTLEPTTLLIGAGVAADPFGRVGG